MFESQSSASPPMSTSDSELLRPGFQAVADVQFVAGIEACTTGHLS